MVQTVAKQDAQVVALDALAWIVGEPARAERFLAVTGLDPADLRARAGSRAVLAAAMSFLAARETDLLACAADLDLPAAALAGAARELGA